MAKAANANTACLPLLIVFDLDYTLWPFYADTHVQPPFYKKDSKIIDNRGGLVRPYEDSEKILKSVKELGIKIGVASRTHAPDIAKEIIDLLGWTKYIDYIQIFSGWKVPHFQAMKKESGIQFPQMLFFDDEERNIRDIGKLGVFCIHVPKGLTRRIFEDALKAFEQDCKNPNKPSKAPKL